MLAKFAVEALGVTNEGLDLALSYNGWKIRLIGVFGLLYFGVIGAC